MQKKHHYILFMGCLGSDYRPFVSRRRLPMPGEWGLIKELGGIIFQIAHHPGWIAIARKDGIVHRFDNTIIHNQGDTL